MTRLPLIAILIIAAFTALACGPRATDKPAPAAPSPTAVQTPAPVASIRQAVVVTTLGWNDINGTAKLLERDNDESPWRQVGEDFSITVGKTGLAWGTGLDDGEFPKPETQNPKKESGPIKKEGDGKSPAGVFSLSGAFGRLDMPAGTKLPYLKVTGSIECVDDGNSKHYNTTVDRAKVGQVDWKSSEKMIEMDPDYDLGVFVDHNPQRVAGGGSCIFLHIWEAPGSPTVGCTAMARENMQNLLLFLDPRKNPVLIQLPVGEYRKLRKAWRLPEINR